MNRRFNSHHLSVLFLVAATLITSTPSVAFADSNTIPAIAASSADMSDQNAQDSDKKTASDLF